MKVYLFLEVKDMSIIVIVEMWIFSVFVKFGVFEMFDYFNIGKVYYLLILFFVYKFIIYR